MGEKKVEDIRMVDLKGQYEDIKTDIDDAIQGVIDGTAFINGPDVKDFSEALKTFLNCEYVIPCANGTDAIQLALMALDLPEGSDIIVPTFNYVAAAEVICLLGYNPVFVDANPNTFGIDENLVEEAITPKTKAIMVVHLFGQSGELEKLLDIAQRHNLKVIEDNAQSIGAKYTFEDGSQRFLGTIGDIGTTSFFPSKNLGCYGDGGAVTCNDPELFQKVRMLASHGQKSKYHYQIIGLNSRLDTVQAAILNEKLKRLDQYISARQKAAAYYDEAFSSIPQISIPKRNQKSTHVFHQYTMKLNGVDRDKVKSKLKEAGVPSMIYYPKPLHSNEAYSRWANKSFPVGESLSAQVLSLPMHTQLDDGQLEFIVNTVKRVIAEP